MKAKFILSIMVLFILFGCKIAPGVLTEKDIEGPWKVVLLKFTTNNTEKYFVPGNSNNREIKIWSKGFFVFAGVHNNFTSSGGGAYKLNGNSYEETYNYYPEASMVDKTYKMRLEITNDTLTLTWPLDAAGEIDKANYNIEKLVRLK